jgi:beta-N-acetylhexosaminidase
MHLAAITAVAATVFGHSADGAPLKVVSQGSTAAKTDVLVVGSIHGNERAGEPIVAALRRAQAPAGVRLHTVRTVNPDSRGRHNARGVDLNRNFPASWRALPRGTFYSGPKAASEPETRAVMALVRRLMPDITVWFHQHLNCVDPSHGADPAVVASYAALVDMRHCSLPRYPGTASRWGNATVPGSSAFVVELPAGSLTERAVLRHRRAIRVLTATYASNSRAHAAAAPQPTIYQDLIPFPASRVRAMRRYSERHYGTPIARLSEPKQIVEHVTAGGTYRSVRDSFAQDVADPELHERPNVCAHFVVDRGGGIHQLVRLNLRCRHTVGLNHVSIGIEHVARTDAEFMGNARQLAASLRLTRWLQARYGIADADVIGHNESLKSRFHYERVARLRTQTHGDMAPATMRRYRDRL